MTVTLRGRFEGSRSARLVRDRAGIVLLATAMTLSVLLPARPALADTTSGSELVVFDNSNTPLTDSHQITVSGTRLPGGACVFDNFPELILGPTQAAIASQQVSADYGTCTTQVEIGTPAYNLSSGASSQQADPSIRASQGFTGTSNNTHTGCPYTGPGFVNTRVNQVYQATGCYSGGGYFRVYWTDVAGIEVNSVRTNINFVVDGACIVDFFGYGEGSWYTPTGWRLDYGTYHADPFSSTNCYETRSIYSNAHYTNPGFCKWIFNVFDGPTTVKYINVTATAYRVAALGGSVQSTDHEEGALCPSLHEHQEVVRGY